jgi:hypothetical protein
MAAFTEIVIHFRTKTGEPRQVVIPAGGGPVLKILLDRKVPPNRPVPGKLKPLIQGGPVEPGDGPHLCYMFDDDMVCW